MRRTISMSFLLYTRWPDFDFSGARLGNSVSQKRRTNGSMSTILQTSPMRKKSLSGISGAGMLHPLLDYNRRPRERKSLANPVLNESLERKVKLLHLIRKHDERGRIDLHLRDVSNFHIQR